jgi:hypothetical protein
VITLVALTTIGVSTYLTLYANPLYEAVDALTAGLDNSDLP